MITSRTLKLSCLSLLSFVLISASTLAAETRNFQEVAFEINGTKVWWPSTLIVKKGDTVKIHAESKIPGKNNIHGFAIDQFKVEALVDQKGKDIEFVANQAGIFPIRCHLHPAHIGGQLVVME